MAELRNKDILEEAYFGPLWSYVQDNSVTDIDFNGKVIWITSIDRPRFFITPDDLGINALFIEQFTNRVANAVSKPFNRMYPELEAETETLRITVIHESVAKSGRLFCIRKSPPSLRFNADEAIEQGYCPKDILDFLIKCVKVKQNIVICGAPGSGKTEFSKFLSQCISENERIVTIEDTLEWHLGQINPKADVIELEVGDVFDYAEALKACMRLNPTWIMLSEARSTEAKYLIEDWSSGLKGITTIHTDDVSKIPDRILNMIGDRQDARRLVNSVYEYVDLGILIKRCIRPDGSQWRRIEQICFFDRKDGENRTRMIYTADEGIMEIPAELEAKFEKNIILSEP